MSRQSIFAWLAALAIVWSCLWISSYTPRDGDGWLYTRIAAEVATRGPAELGRVGWYGTCRIYDESSPGCQYFYEHPPGIFLLPVLLAQGGVPVARATIFADTLYQLVWLFAAFALAKRFLGESAAGFGMLAGLLLPVSFVHALKATHETPMLAALALGTLAVVHWNAHPLGRDVALFFVAAFAALMKGLMAAPLIACCAWFATAFHRDLRQGVRIGLVMLAGAYVALTYYDHIHIALVGQSFWRSYLDIQLWHRSLEPATRTEVVLRTLQHLLFYAGCLAWFAAPWSLLALRANRGRFVLTIAIALCVLPVSVFGRESLRYIFPAYYLLAALGVSELYRRYPYWARATPAAVALVWCVTRCGVIILNAVP